MEVVKLLLSLFYENSLPSLLRLNFPTDDIPPYGRELFIKSRVRSVVNVDSGEIGQSPVRDLNTGEITSDHILYCPIEACYIKYLTAMGVKYSVVALVIHKDQLWGLLASHHSQARDVVEYEVEAMQLVVEQLSVAMAHNNNLLIQARAKAEREIMINGIATLLHSLPTIGLQPALEAIVAAFNGVGGRLCIRHDAFNFQHSSF
jgi:light-regulated signal transduction histidine kinase (bacteriophytochrome)